MGNRENRLLVLAPTRELAQQIVDEMESFAKGCGIRIALVIGGASMNNQVRDLRANPRVVVGTPGRIKDHIAQKSLDLSRSTASSSTRWTDARHGLIPRHHGDPGDGRQAAAVPLLQRDHRRRHGEADRPIRPRPKTVSTRVGETADGVNQDVVWYREKDEKIDLLHDILIGQGCEKTIIFDDTKHSVEKLCKQLVARALRPTGSTGTRAKPSVPARSSE
jgi:ATP-dependent RNA helicase DeaD